MGSHATLHILHSRVVIKSLLLQISLPAKMATKHIMLFTNAGIVFGLENPFGKIKVKDLEEEGEE